MERIEKTVFISYRRTNVPWALAIYQHLTHHGFDVFFDYQSIASGDFEQIILESIKARAHFIVLLTPSALERCSEPGDWFRREIETALATQRNIVPLMLEGFEFTTPVLAQHLTGKLGGLKSYNALRVPAEYFDEAMARLRERYLNVPLDAVVHRLSANVRKTVKIQQAAARVARNVEQIELTAQQWFEQGYKTKDVDEQIHCYTEAIRLNPDYAHAYINRGAAYAKDDLDLALEDYAEAIRLNPDYARAYFNRAQIWRQKGDRRAAIADFQKYLNLREGTRSGDQATVVKFIRDLK